MAFEGAIVRRPAWIFIFMSTCVCTIMFNLSLRRSYTSGCLGSSESEKSVEAWAGLEPTNGLVPETYGV
jgi:hypothetical protein